MTDRELMQMALDALEVEHSAIYGTSQTEKAIEALRARLAQPEHGDGYRWREGDVPPSITYTTPPQREWQGLTDEEITETLKRFGLGERAALARAIEAKLKEKNA